MGLLQDLMNKTEKFDFLFPNDFEELMDDEYYDYDKFEWFLYYVFKFEGCKVEKIGAKGKGDGGVDLILNIPQDNGTMHRIGIQAKYWKNRVGVQPINQLASAKTIHNLTELWLITTSDLTSPAKEITEQMNIKVLRKEDVVRLIDAVKERHEDQIAKNGKSSIEFLKADKVKKQDKINVASSKQSLDSLELMKQFRIEISKKYKLYPVYNVFNNKMMTEIIEHKPTTLAELSGINGFGAKRLEKFGKELLEFVKNNLIDLETSNLNSELYDFLITERKKIAQFNKLEESDVYTDKVAKYLVKMKPENIETLDRVYGFRKENINIFGDYLVKIISRFISRQNG